MNQFLHSTLRNVIWFKRSHDNGELEMKPPFQRNPVWVDRQKSFLIDSILRGYPIPEIYMQEVITGTGASKQVIVDGQQRIRAVLEFLEGKFSMDPVESSEWADMYFDDLTEDEKKKIFGYNFIVRILPSESESQIRAIFQRINMNVLALNKQELRQATYRGPFIQLMKKLSDKEIWRTLNVFTPNDVRRMLDVEYISELTIAMLNGLQNKKEKLEDFYKFYESEFDDVAYVEESFSIILSELIKILPNLAKTRWRKKTDFYTLFLHFHNHIKELPLSKEKRLQAADALVKFADEVDRFVKSDEVLKSGFMGPVYNYGPGIRASTDLGSRKRRAEALNLAMKEIWN